MNNAKNSKTTLLVMDIQKEMMDYLPDSAPLLKTIEKAIAAARNADITVIFVTLNFREGHPEIHQEHAQFGPVKASKFLFTNSHEGTPVHSAVAPLNTDIIVVKKRVSAFSGSDLEILLRSHKTESLVLSGFSTNGVVLSTVREAADKDYHLTVLSDACADPDASLHDYLINKVLPFSAEVTTTAEWIKSLS